MEPLNTTPKITLIGFDKLQNYLEKQAGQFDCIKIANSVNDKTNFRKEFSGKGGDMVPKLIDYLQEWSPADAPYTWYIVLYKGTKQIERLPFSAKSGNANYLPAVSGIGADMVPRDIVEQLAAARERAAVAEYKMSEMAREMQESDDDEPETDYLGKVVEQAMPYMPVLVESLIGFLKGHNKPLQVSGVPDEAAECLEILMQNGVTLEHLQKLVKMANDGKLKNLLLML